MYLVKVLKCFVLERIWYKLNFSLNSRKGLMTKLATFQSVHVLTEKWCNSTQHVLTIRWQDIVPGAVRKLKVSEIVVVVVVVVTQTYLCVKTHKIIYQKVSFSPCVNFLNNFLKCMNPSPSKTLQFNERKDSKCLHSWSMLQENKRMLRELKDTAGHRKPKPSWQVDGICNESVEWPE